MMAKHYRSGDGSFLKKKITPKFSVLLWEFTLFSNIQYKMPDKNIGVFDFFVTKLP